MGQSDEVVVVRVSAHRRRRLPVGVRRGRFREKAKQLGDGLRVKATREFRACDDVGQFVEEMRADDELEAVLPPELEEEPWRAVRVE